MEPIFLVQQFRTGQTHALVISYKCSFPPRGLRISTFRPPQFLWEKDCRYTASSDKMSNVEDPELEIEMQGPVAQAEGASSTLEIPEVPNGVNLEKAALTPTERKASQFRGRQIQMMAISLTPTRSRIGPNIQVSLLAQDCFLTQAGFFTLMDLCPYFWDIYLSGRSCTR